MHPPGHPRSFPSHFSDSTCLRPWRPTSQVAAHEPNARHPCSYALSELAREFKRLKEWRRGSESNRRIKVCRPSSCCPKFFRFNPHVPICTSLGQIQAN